MSDAPVQNPHDKLFKEAFSRTDAAASFFKSYLPPEIADRLNWDTLKHESGAYTDEHLQHSDSDLLYSVQIDDRPVFLYCLFEHQSAPDHWMPLRLLRYIVRIWEQYRKQNPTAKTLPPVLPLVLFQGGTKWTADLRMSGLIDVPDGLIEFQPEFRHLLVDLSDYDFSALKGDLLTRTVLLALKVSRGPNSEDLFRIIDLLIELYSQNDTPGMLRAILRYLWSVDNTISLQDYVHMLEHRNQPELREEFMTVAEQLEKKGRQEGREEGREEGRREEAASLLRRILVRRFGLVPDALLATINDASLEQLESWTDAALDASTVEDVFV
jgi:predicted transposase/invertase (TIGR01784 family)